MSRAPSPRTWTRDQVCPPHHTDVVHDRDRRVWRRQPGSEWLADEVDATPGRWEDLVRVFGPITEGLPPPPAATEDTRRWRVGAHYGIHVYAVTSGYADDEPVATATTRAAAEQIVTDHNNALAAPTTEEAAETPVTARLLALAALACIAAVGAAAAVLALIADGLNRSAEAVQAELETAIPHPGREG